MISASFPSLLQSFFTDRLQRQRQASPHTVAGYRDCFRLLLKFAKERLGMEPSQVQVEDLDAPFLGLFLDHLESTRKNSARTRNIRLGAIHSFFRYVALEEPAHALHCQRILAMPNKRHVQRPIDFLNREEIEALLAVPNSSTWLGRRDRTLLSVAVQTGLRVSELIRLNCQNVVLGTGSHVRCLGKGRKERCTPLRPEVTKMLRGLALRTPRSTRRPCLPQQAWQPTQPGCGGESHHKVRPSCCPELPLAPREESHPACLPPFGSHGPSSARRGSIRDRALAGARVSRNGADLSPRGHAFERASALAHSPAGWQPEPLPAG